MHQREIQKSLTVTTLGFKNMGVVVHPNFSRHPIRDWPVSIFVKVSTILSDQNHIIINDEVVYVIKDSVGTTIRVGPRHPCSLRFVQRDANMIKTIGNLPKLPCLPHPIVSWQAHSTGQKLLHSGLFEVPLLGGEPIQRFQQRIHIVQHGRDGALFEDIGRQIHRFNVKIVAINSRHSAFPAERCEVKSLQKIVDKLWVVTMEITNV